MLTQATSFAQATGAGGCQVQAETARNIKVVNTVGFIREHCRSVSETLYRAGKAKPCIHRKGRNGRKGKAKTKSLKEAGIYPFFHLVFPLRPLRPLRWILAFVFPAPSAVRFFSRAPFPSYAPCVFDSPRDTAHLRRRSSGKSAEPAA